MKPALLGMETKPVISGDNQETQRDDKGRFKPGVSGNVLGKPKGIKSLPSIIKKIGSKIPQGENENQLELIMRKQFELALKGNHRSAQLIFERLEGKAFTPIKVENENIKSPYEHYLNRLTEKYENSEITPMEYLEQTLRGDKT